MFADQFVFPILLKDCVTSSVEFGFQVGGLRCGSRVRGFEFKVWGSRLGSG